ncbi:PTS sugar transporter subunit IIA [Holdemania massiliensis]|uniref:PTS sugar transporter subunit IIA n=1 Tax=Holdemania massiliensis TaxID=1468449 RepID=UPI001F05064D|nr:PTS sugar transporter subunit IIA [Holdemania massiliensis]MCH1942344.1 PTS sugar transporter subunit IIA [Holdemania massiliensis]
MIGIILVSHGKMAEGIINSATLFFGDKIEQMAAVSLQLEDTPDDFLERLKAQIVQNDTGEGVLILADLLGGTPCNLAATLMNEHIHIISGMNLGLILEVLGLRESGNLDWNELAETAKNGIMHLNTLLD